MSEVPLYAGSLKKAGAWRESECGRRLKGQAREATSRAPPRVTTLPTATVPLYPNPAKLLYSCTTYFTAVQLIAQMYNLLYSCTTNYAAVQSIIAVHL